MKRRFVVALALLGAGCSQPLSSAGSVAVPDVAAITAPPLSVVATVPSGAPPAREACGATPTEIGRIRDIELDEISGVAESTKNPAVLFVHNDSGDSPRFFAINRAGELLAELTLETVPLLLDAEDLAIGPGPGGASFIYLGDTGNNFASFGAGIPRRKAVIYRIPEPEVPTSARHARLSIKEAFPIVLTFPLGARDVEAFFVDPISRDLFIITKQPDGHSQLLTASAAQLEGGGGPLTFLAELRFGQPPLPGSPMPTSAAISQDGSAILVRTYSSVFLFSRAPGESVPDALKRTPRSLPSPREAQGEAIAFADFGQTFITISEGVKAAVNCVSFASPANR